MPIGDFGAMITSPIPFVMDIILSSVRLLVTCKTFAQIIMIPLMTTRERVIGLLFFLENKKIRLSYNVLVLQIVLNLILSNVT